MIGNLEWDDSGTKTFERGTSDERRTKDERRTNKGRTNQKLKSEQRATRRGDNCEMTKTSEDVAPDAARRPGTAWSPMLRSEKGCASGRFGERHQIADTDTADAANQRLRTGIELGRHASRRHTRRDERASIGQRE